MEDGYVVNRRLQFVSNYEWIWNIKMTRLFVDSHLLKIPQEVRLVIATPLCPFAGIGSLVIKMKFELTYSVSRHHNYMKN